MDTPRPAAAPDADFPELTAWARLLADAYAPESLRTRLSHARAFLTWLAARGRALPASGAELAGYLGERSDLKPTSLRRHALAVGLLHRDLGHGDPAASRPVELALMAARRQRGGPRRQAAPIDPGRIARIAARPDSGLVALRDATMLQVAGDAGLRRGEIVGLDVDDLIRQPDGYATLWIRRAKTDPEGIGAPANLSRGTARALDRWLRATGLTRGPLFPRLGRSGQPEGRLNPNRVTTCYRRAARAAGLPGWDSLTSHSPRVGLAQDLLARGMSPERVAQQARWAGARMPLAYAERAPAHLSAAAERERQDADAAQANAARPHGAPPAG